MVPSSIGAHFRVTLPAVTEVSDAGPPSSGDRSGAQRVFQAPASIRSVLFVDDEVSLLSAYERLYEQQYDVSTCDGHTALLKLQGGETFDLIVCDLIMPGVDGPEIYDWVAEHRPELLERLVFSSGAVLSERAKAFVKRSECVPLAKPVMLGQFEENAA